MDSIRKKMQSIKVFLTIASLSIDDYLETNIFSQNEIEEHTEKTTLLEHNILEDNETTERCKVYVR